MAGLVFMVALFLVHQHTTLLLFGLVLLLGGARSGLPLGLLFRGLKPVALVAAFSLTFQAFWLEGHVVAQWGPLTLTREGLERGGLLALRLVYLAWLSTLVTLTTSPIAVTDALERLLRPLGRLGHELAMVSAIALRFIPILALEAERIARAQMARGARLDNRWPWVRLKATLPILIPLLIRGFQHADDLAMSMEARCYTGGPGRTRLANSTLNWKDAAFVLGSLACAAGMVWLERGLS